MFGKGAVDPLHDEAAFPFAGDLYFNRRNRAALLYKMSRFCAGVK